MLQIFTDKTFITGCLYKPVPIFGDVTRTVVDAKTGEEKEITENVVVDTAMPEGSFVIEEDSDEAKKILAGFDFEIVGESVVILKTKRAEVIEREAKEQEEVERREQERIKGEEIMSSRENLIAELKGKKAAIDFTDADIKKIVIQLAHDNGYISE